MNSINFTRLNAQDVLLNDALTEYEQEMNFFYLDQLVPLNASIYVMEQILQFPFNMFTATGDNIFFTLVWRNFFQAGILTITRLATDKKTDLHTLVHFKNWVCGQVKPEYRQEYQFYLKRARFDKETRTMLAKAKQLRDTQVAHLKRDFNLSKQDRLNFEELKRLSTILSSLLDTLSFNVDRLMLPPQYSPRVTHPRDTDNRSDIEKLLDGIARDSAILNLPESESAYWPIYRNRLSLQDLEILNKYRAKFKLPQV
jgi:hypothetical protein